MSSYLVPQLQIENPVEKLKVSPFFNEMDSFYRGKSINQDLINIVIHKIVEAKLSVDSSLFDDTEYNGYKWSQRDNIITIQYTFPDKESDNSVEFYHDNYIKSKSGFISGKLFKTYQKMNVIYDGNQVNIQLSVDEPWNVLISGGEMDPDSTYILGVAAMKLNLNDEAESLLVDAALRGHSLSMKQLAYYYRDKKEYPKEFYWNVHLYTKFESPTAFASICEYLLEFSNDEENAKIAECILVENAIKEIPIAYLYLGYLHLKDIKGFNSDRSLAFKYFEVSSNKFRNKKATEVLAKLYITGIGVEPDVEKGLQLLDEIGASQDDLQDIRDMQSSELPPESVTPTHNPEEEINKPAESNTILYISIAVGVIVGSLLIGYSFIRRRSTTHK